MFDWRCGEEAALRLRVPGRSGESEERRCDAVEEGSFLKGSGDPVVYKIPRSAAAAA